MVLVGDVLVGEEGEKSIKWQPGEERAWYSQAEEEEKSVSGSWY